MGLLPVILALEFFWDRKTEAGESSKDWLDTFQGHDCVCRIKDLSEHTHPAHPEFCFGNRRYDIY
jgi:hypothetical protein